MQTTIHSLGHVGQRNQAKNAYAGQPSQKGDQYKCDICVCTCDVCDMSQRVEEMVRERDMFQIVRTVNENSRQPFLVALPFSLHDSFRNSFILLKKNPQECVYVYMYVSM